MSLKFKSEADNNSGDKPQNDNVNVEKNIEYHEGKSHVRNICFVETSGKQTSLNYSYLIATEFNPDESIIQLFFSTHTVLIGGNNLNSLFEYIEIQKVKRVHCLKERYIYAKDDSECFIKTITIEMKS